MKFKNITVLFFMLMSNLSFSADTIERNINLSAHIDNEGFYSYSVTKFGFKKPNLEIEYDQKEAQFISKATEIYIRTDIPVGFNAGYEITPSHLDSSCVDVVGNVVEEDFATYYLDGNELQVNEPIVFDSFSDSDSVFLSDIREFSIEFAPTPDLDVWKSRCKGSATVYIALSF